MATLITQIDRQTGNFEEAFIYSLNASFNGISGSIESAQITMLIPNNIDIFLGDVKDPVKEVRENILADGREIVFDFGSIIDLGIAVRIGFGLTFNQSSVNGDSFILNSKMIINGEEIVTYDSEEITLVLNEQFEISREIVLPSVAPSAGSAVYYKLTLENFGDLGAVINNLSIRCNGSNLISLDQNYPVVGRDVSSKFADISADDLTGAFDGNSLVFDIPSYKGQRYEFIYRALVADSAEIGEGIPTICNWSIDTVTKEDEVHEENLAGKIFDADITLYAPDYTLPAEYICFRMNFENSGNQILQNVILENDLPTQVNYYELNTGSFYIGEIGQNLSAEYFIDYQTANGVTGELGPFNSDVNTTVDLTTIIPENDSLTILFWRLNTMSIGLQSKNPLQLLGIVKPETQIDSSLLNHMDLSFINDDEETIQIVENTTTLVANFCTLNPSFSSSVASNPVRPNQEFTFNLNANCSRSRLKNPIFAIILPKEYEYLGNEQYSYSDIFTATTPPQPVVRTIPDFDANGSTLVKFEFINENEFSFRQLANISINFDVSVAVGALGNVGSFLLLNTVGSTGVIPNSLDVYIDTNNIAEDSSVSQNYAKSNILVNRILYFVSTSSNKKVKGLLDTEYVEEPEVGRTFDGGSLEYLITVTNIGNANLEEVEVVDILPYIGDTGVISTSSPRNSEYPIYALTEVVATLVPSEEEVEFDIFYSTSTDPVRFGASFDIIGTDDNWTNEPPSDLSLLKAFKVRTKDIVLLPNQSLRIAITASIPTGLPVSAIAWNSFATDVIYRDLENQEQHLLAIEPEKVGVQVVESDPNLAKISGYSFFDSNSDGYYSDKDSLVNDVMAVLYDENLNQLRFTATRTDALGNDGQYSFEALPLAKYYVKFFIDDKQLKFTEQRLDADNGNKADRQSGVTQLLDLTVENLAENINVGIISKSQHTLSEILKVNRQARGMVRDVIKNEMLLVMKEEDLLDLISN